MIPAVVIGGLVLATLAALVVGQGSPAIAVAPLGVAIAGAVLVRATPRQLMFGLLAVCLCVESPQDRPAHGMWESPLYPLGKLLYQSVGGVPLAPFEMLVWALLAAALLKRHDGRGELPPAAWALRPAVVLFGGVMFGLLAYGLARGGNTQAAFWQTRQLLLLAPVAFLFHESLRGTREELAALGKVIVGSACFKAFLGAYFHFAIVRPRGLDPMYVTTHADTVLFVLALLVLGFWWVEQRSRRSLAALALFGGIILVGVVLNDRRIAWAELGAGAATLFLLLRRGRAKQFAFRRALWVLPVIALYAAAGWNSDAPFFAPLRALNSMTETKDSSTFAREVENYNLAHTVRQAPLFGQGWGHPYEEAIHHKIGRSFDLFLYIPHNSIYWLFMVGGALGFAALWLVISFAVLLGVRAHRAAADPHVRTASLGCVALILLFAFQAWGDMGTQSHPPVWLVALALALSGRLAVVSGAWPTVAAAAAAQNLPVERREPTLEVCR